ncbi:MAG TPA: hypothetical protein VFC54_14620 [Pseudolabrys sp.]|nr:hypothetical protein [Pseudolabrys sp.]
MRKSATVIAAFGVALFLTGGPQAAKAQAPDQAEGSPTLGVGVICNTSEQAEHFVNLRNKGTQAKQAMDAINAQEHDPGACGVVAVAFTRDKTVNMRTMGDKLIQIVRINVLAGYNGSAWQRVSGLMIQYAVMEGEGETI